MKKILSIIGTFFIVLHYNASGSLQLHPTYLMLPPHLTAQSSTLEQRLEQAQEQPIMRGSGGSAGIFPPPPVFGMSYVRTVISKGDINHAVEEGGAMYTISSPGYYVLASNINANPQHNNTSCIRIAANDIILDLSAHTISQKSTSTAYSMNGIEVMGRSNQFAVINGGLSHINGTGIKINATASNFLVSTLLINNCTLFGCYIDAVTNIAIENMVVTNCNGDHPDAIDGACGVRINNASEIRFSDSYFNTNQAKSPTVNSSGIICSNVRSTRFVNCAASGQRGANAYGFRFLNNSQSCILRDCGALNLYATNGSSYGIFLENSSAITIQDWYAGSLTAIGGESCGIMLNNSAVIDILNALVKGTVSINGFSATGYKCLNAKGCRLSNCHALANIATTGSAYGFYLMSCEGNLCNNCEARGNTASTSEYDGYGFYSESGVGNAFNACRAIGNSGGRMPTSIAAGFALRNGEMYSSITESVASGSNTVGEAYGVMLGHTGETAPTAYATVHKNYFVYNLGSKSYGYRDFAPYTTTILTSNIAYGQGPVHPSIDSPLTLTNAMNFMFVHAGNQPTAGTVTEATISTLHTVTTGTPLMNLSLTLQP